MTRHAAVAVRLGAVLGALAVVALAGGGARELVASRARTVTVGLSPDSVSGVRGQTFAVTLQADLAASGRALGSYAVTITWDSAVARVDSVRPGAYGAPLVNYVNGGEVRLTQVNTTGMAGSFSLAQLFVRIVNDTVGRRTPVLLSFTDLVATDFTDLRPEAAIVNGVVRVAAPPVVVHFTPDSTYERVGFKPAIDLTADLSAAGSALGSYALAFTWDATVMVFDSIRAGDYAMPQWNQSAPGELRLTSADPVGRGGAPFSLARLYFSYVDATFPRVTSLALSVTEMAAAGSFANLLPGVTTRTGKAVIGGVLRGDVDVNGALAALDAQLILQAAVGLALPNGLPGLPHGDADCGGTLQARDAQIVLNAVVGNAVGQFCVARIQ